MKQYLNIIRFACIVLLLQSCGTKSKQPDNPIPDNPIPDVATDTTTNTKPQVEISRTLQLTLNRPIVCQMSKEALLIGRQYWQKGDTVQFYFSQNGTCMTGETLTVADIAADSLSARFSINLPDSINAANAYSLYAVSGVRAVIASGRLLLDARPQSYFTAPGEIVRPLYLKLDSLRAGSVAAISDTLATYGAIQQLTLKNLSKTAIQLNRLRLGFTGNPWFLTSLGELEPAFDPATGTSSRQAVHFGTSPQLTKSYQIRTDMNLSLVRWVVPTGAVPASIQLTGQVDGQACSASTPAYSQPLDRGANHREQLYAIYDGNGFIFSNERATRVIRMVLTTGKRSGNTIRLTINAERSDRDGVWVDLNDNAIRESNEEIKYLGAYQDYKIQSQRITIYGKVTSLSCGSNQLTSLETSANPVLSQLYCSENELTTLDLSGNMVLNRLICDNNKLTTLPLPSNQVLRDVRCYNNKLTSLYVSKNPALTILKCGSNKLSTLNISANKELVKLSCSDNELKAINVSANKALEDLSCSNNKLSRLDVSANLKLKTLYCRYNKLTKLDVSKNSALTELVCGSNELKSLDVSQNRNLTHLSCQWCAIGKLDVSSNTRLLDLRCNDCNLRVLNVSSNRSLTHLECTYNHLTKLDVSQCRQLEFLYCNSNHVSELNISGCSKLSYLSCPVNQLAGSDMTKLMQSLPAAHGEIEVIDTDEAEEKNQCTAEHVKIAKGKGWTVVDTKGKAYTGF